jgi:hypothetical protein
VRESRGSLEKTELNSTAGGVGNGWREELKEKIKVLI